MENNDIGVNYVARYAVRFEGLLMHRKETPVDTEEEPDGFLSRFRKRSSSSPPVVRESKLWRPNDMPMRSLLNFVNRLHYSMVIVTYLGEEYEEEITEWLARKGVFATVLCYDDAFEWAEDLRRNPEIKGYYTADEAERDIIGWQHVTVVPSTSTFGA